MNIINVTKSKYFLQYYIFYANIGFFLSYLLTIYEIT